MLLSDLFTLVTTFVCDSARDSPRALVVQVDVSPSE